MGMPVQDVGVKIADAAAAGTIAGAAWVNLAQINTIVQIGAGIVAIIAGLAAAAYHAYKFYDLRQARKEKE